MRQRDHRPARFHDEAEDIFERRTKRPRHCAEWLVARAADSSAMAERALALNPHRQVAWRAMSEGDRER